jgi:hypothetical protein
MTSKKLKRTIGSVIASAFLTLWTAAAHAVVPEIEIDPVTGVAAPRPDLTAALAAIETGQNPTQIAEIRWRRAPWHRS